jgi:hypothetical protein
MEALMSAPFDLCANDIYVLGVAFFTGIITRVYGIRDPGTTAANPS